MRFPDLSLSVVKLLGSGEYALEVPGAAERRALRARRAATTRTRPRRTAAFPTSSRSASSRPRSPGGARPTSNDELAALAAHCTAQQENAAKVERQVAKSAAALLLSSRIGDTFDGIVTGASEKGTWVRISMPTDRRTRRARLSTGSTSATACACKLVHTDVERGFIDFAAERSRS